jgi:hypothetical protein
LANAFGGLVANAGPNIDESRAPIPTINQAAYLREAASPGLLRVLGISSGPTANTTPPNAAPTANAYTAPLLVANATGNGATDPLPDLHIDYRAAASPGLLKALGL